MTRIFATRRASWTPLLPLMPASVRTLCVVALPLVFSFWTSLMPNTLIKPETLWEFLGLQSHVRLSQDWELRVVFGRVIRFLTIALERRTGSS